jgi:hypothetical protein
LYWRGAAWNGSSPSQAVRFSFRNQAQGPGGDPLWNWPGWFSTGFASPAAVHGCLAAGHFVPVAGRSRAATEQACAITESVRMATGQSRTAMEQPCTVTERARAVTVQVRAVIERARIETGQAHSGPEPFVLQRNDDTGDRIANEFSFTLASATEPLYEHPKKFMLFR